MLSEKSLHGVIVPIVTPFDQRGNLDINSFQKLVVRLKSSGIHGLVVNGTTGESPTIEDAELEAMIAAARSVLGETPLIVGTGSNNTAATIKKTALAKALGADAALVVTPYYNRPSQQGIIEHFRALAEADLPIILYDIPHRTGVTLELDTVKVIMKMDHIIGLKESTGNIKRLMRLVSTIPKPILCGEDELFFASLCCGGKGGILASANLDTKQFVQVYELFGAGKIDASRERFDQLLPLILFLFSEPNPAPLKWLLAQRRHIRTDRLRLPMTSISSDSAEKGVQLL
ncbi:4-hydroxy-tetrahydrodipicolinate synthase [Paenibacillus oralis]|uniref:4-hydroxy-tetrahydrodipicolinate synthase n=1 Tax=Paenibacillus oralis TaxID=2490856 RepID=A0A3P3UAB6_9BACL|nr:4-hydroxy-tetrahydrodipicolinate synthase [Paenibacillus oralis]RRJ67295.1 4-hydroxy-tetrahydrodipicolinate synthase [Paenibacillus oralis]